jgi:hypothetical protein
MGGPRHFATADTPQAFGAHQARHALASHGQPFSADTACFHRKFTSITGQHIPDWFLEFDRVRSCWFDVDMITFGQMVSTEVKGGMSSCNNC